MLYFDRTDVSGGTDVSKTSVFKIVVTFVTIGIS